MKIFHKIYFHKRRCRKKLYNGRINESKALDLMRTEMSFLNADAFLLCGPEEMIFSSKKALESLGVVKEKRNLNFLQHQLKMIKK